MKCKLLPENSLTLLVIGDISAMSRKITELLPEDRHWATVLSYMHTLQPCFLALFPPDNSARIKNPKNNPAVKPQRYRRVTYLAPLSRLALFSPLCCSATPAFLSTVY